jgi:hypothetical protein
VVKLQVTENGSALNRVHWDPSGSGKCASGSSDGRVFIHDLSTIATLALAEDYLSMQRALQQQQSALTDLSNNI